MRAGERGYTFVAVLVLLALVTLGTSMAGPVWSEQVRREREQDLLRIGALYARAIASYRDISPGSTKQYPRSLDELLLDTRFVTVRRHLRARYPDPVTGGQAWGLVTDAENRVIGVYSLSQETPLAEAPSVPGLPAFARAQRYSDWKFIAPGRP